jgi:hypothetical protein
MASPEEIAQELELLAIHRKTLAIYLKQQATFGEAYTPPANVHGVREARENIQRIKEILRGWNVQVEDGPDDEEPVFDGARSLQKTLTADQRALIGTWKMVQFIGKVAAFGLVGITDVTMVFAEDGCFESYPRVRLMFLTVPQHFSGVYSFTSENTIHVETTQNEKKDIATYQFSIANDQLRLASPGGFTIVLKRAA